MSNKNNLKTIHFYRAKNETSECLMKLLNEDRRIHLVPANVHGKYFLRFAVCSTKTSSQDIVFAWKVISELTDSIVNSKFQN